MKESDFILNTRDYIYACVTQQSFKATSILKDLTRQYLSPKQSVVFKHLNSLHQEYFGMSGIDVTPQSSELVPAPVSKVPYSAYRGGSGWMLLAEGGDRPTMVHLSEEVAVVEAKKLAREFRKPIYMFKAVRRFQVEEAPVQAEEIS